MIYREGVIKLGFFIRSKQAAAFRQWATDVIVDHMDEKGITLESVFSAINDLKSDFGRLERTVGQQRDEIDELKAMLECVLDKKEENELRALIQEVKKAKSMDGRAIVGHVKKTLGVHTPYEKTSLAQAKNVLRNMLGRGVMTVK